MINIPLSGTIDPVVDMKVNLIIFVLPEERIRSIGILFNNRKKGSDCGIQFSNYFGVGVGTGETGP